ncbi:Sodium-dependent nutrient amino acid transporter 1 [Pseudolycoriella hygida]|uniref:Transporter n=1 Tax=Pseudolycoriella hygida TaxID=35572 RepID=A0A9Q0MV41_9DIPT|nr:Sodium-dependent nutrient amino acid transporter 1 [Pseudolycoriella hygida]
MDEETKQSESTEEQSPAAKKERQEWSNSIEFLMSCIATSVGLGNIWRFPFTAYENGGGAFLIPYIIVLFLIGKPIYYLEMFLGQFNSRSSIKVYNFCPGFRGIGVGQILSTVCVITYYASLIALTLYYLVASFAKELPWSTCLEGWGSDCVDSRPKSFDNITTYAADTRQISSSEIYFLKFVLKEKSDISDGIGWPDWKLVLCLLGSWIVVFFVIIRGVKSSGKASYFLALFPYVVILILLVHACTLEGSKNGILFFLKPQWGELLNAKVWHAATTQLFFSLSVGMGPIIMFSSHNKFSHNIYRDAMIVTTLDTFTSLMAGLTIFAILGNLAHNLGIEDISTVVKGGTGLAFISYPDAISKFEVVPQLFAALFFFMLFVLGIGSVVALQSAVVTVIVDQFYFKHWKVVVVTCISGFLLGLVYLTPGGQWMLNLVDYYGGTLLIFCLAVFETAGLFWIYGLENYCWDLEFMTGRNPSVYWRACWAFITPVLMAVIFIYSMANVKPLTYSGWDYPLSLSVFGWAIFAVGFAQFPLWGIWIVSRNSKLSFWESLKETMKPNKKWGPADPEKYLEWQNYRKDAKEKRVKEVKLKNHSYLRQKLYIFLGKYR